MRPWDYCIGLALDVYRMRVSDWLIGANPVYQDGKLVPALHLSSERFFELFSDDEIEMRERTTASEYLYEASVMTPDGVFCYALLIEEQKGALK